MRSRVVLLAAEGRGNTELSRQLSVTLHTVGRWRQRYLDQRLDGLVDEPRSGTSSKLRDQQVERVLALTLESTPADATHWSTRALARKTGLSHVSIHRIWRAFPLAPHCSETFKLSKNPLFIDEVRALSACIWHRQIALWFCVSMRSARFRRWTVLRPCCRCAPDRSNGAHTTMCVTARDCRSDGYKLAALRL
jgi:transposase